MDVDYEGPVGFRTVRHGEEVHYKAKPKKEPHPPLQHKQKKKKQPQKPKPNKKAEVRKAWRRLMKEYNYVPTPPPDRITYHIPMNGDDDNNDVSTGASHTS